MEKIPLVRSGHEELKVYLRGTSVSHGHISHEKHYQKKFMVYMSVCIFTFLSVSSHLHSEIFLQQGRALSCIAIGLEKLGVKSQIVI